MALPTKFLSFFFLLTLLSNQIQARDSQFFSKFTNVNNNEKETQRLPNKQETSTVVTRPEQEPTFIPQTQNGYGLYGHESSELPSTTANGEEPTTTSNFGHTTYAPYVTPITHPEEFYRPDQEAINRYRQIFNSGRYNLPTITTNSNNKNNPENTKNGVRGYSTMSSTHENSFYNNDNVANKYVNNDERQGMSDTRFVEGGKFYYDINSEKNFQPNQYGNSRVVESRNNWANNKGYFGNSHVTQNMPHDSFEGFQNDDFSENEDQEFEP